MTSSLINKKKRTSFNKKKLREIGTVSDGLPDALFNLDEQLIYHYKRDEDMRAIYESMMKALAKRSEKLIELASWSYSKIKRLSSENKDLRETLEGSHYQIGKSKSICSIVEEDDAWREIGWHFNHCMVCGNWKEKCTCGR